MTSRVRLAAGAALSAAALCIAMLPASPVSAATAQTGFDRWTSTADFAKGTSTGLAARTDSVTIGAGTSTTTYDDPHVSGGARTYDRGIWTSPWASTGFDAKSLVPSWSIATPGGSFARIDVRVRTGRRSGAGTRSVAGR